MDTVRWVTLFYASPGLADETEDALRTICETMARQELERQGYRAGAVTVVDWEFAKLSTPGVLGVHTRADVEILERPADPRKPGGIGYDGVPGPGPGE